MPFAFLLLMLDNPSNCEVYVYFALFLINFRIFFKEGNVLSQILLVIGAKKWVMGLRDLGYFLLLGK